MTYDKDWTLQLADKISNCSFFLCLLSENYVNSEYCMFEFSYALKTEIIPINITETYSSEFIKIVLGGANRYKFSTFLENFLNERKYLSCKPELFYKMFDFDTLNSIVNQKNSVFKFDNENESINYDNVVCFESNLEKYRKEAYDLGYYNIDENGKECIFNEVRPLLRKIALVRNSDGRRTLMISFITYQNGRYLEQKAIRSWVINNKDTQIMPFLSGVGNSYNFSGSIWSICGGGIWCITKDNYLIYSFRKKVGEYAECYGYSAAGGYSSENNDKTPFTHIVEEVRTELGVEISPNELNMISIGIDLTRAIVQFSFFARIPFTFSEVHTKHQTCVERDELQIYSCKANQKDIRGFILSNKYDSMEPGAKISLKNLLKLL